MTNGSLRAIRLRQGQEWIAREAHIESWPASKRATALAELEAAHGPSLDALVELHRAHMWSLLTERGLIPEYGGIANPRRHGALPDAPPPPKPRGLAKALKPKARRARTPGARQRDLFGAGP